MPDQTVTSAGPRPGAAPSPLAVPWWRRIANRFWGYDFFVSYHWASGGAYAVKLAEALRDRRFDCFLDRSEFASGDDWKAEARQALANTQRLIVVGTHEALTISAPVRDEVSMFTARSERVIPILFGERIPDDQRDRYPALKLISHRVVEIVEAAENQATGPSNDVLERIEHAHRVLRRRRLRVVAVSAVIVVLACAALAATLSFFNAEVQRRVAQRALVESQRELAQSLVDRGVREVSGGQRVGLLRLRRAYEIANRLHLDPGTDIPRDEVMSRSARRLLAGWQSFIGTGLLHGQDLIKADLSPDGRLVRTMTRNIDGEPTGYEFWDARSGRPLGTRIAVDDAAPDIVMSPDWTTAIHWSGSTLRRFDLSTGESRVLKPPPVDDDASWDRPAPAHSLDGKWAVQPDGRSVTIWNLETGAPAKTATPAFEAPGRVSFSADGRELIVTNADHTAVQLFDVFTGASRGPPLTVNARIAAVLDSGSGASAAVVVLEDGEVLLWRPATGAVVVRLGPMDPRPQVRFSPMGETLLVTSGGRGQFVDAHDGGVKGEIRHEGVVALAVFSPDGSILATTDEPRTPSRRNEPRSLVHVWDVRTAVQQFHFSRKAEASNAVSFSPNGELLLARTVDGFEVFDARTGDRRGGGAAPTRPCGADGHSAADCRRIAFSADSRLVNVVSWRERVATLVQVALPDRVLAHPDGTGEAALSKDGGRLLTAFRDGGVQLWNLDTGKPVAEPSRTGEPVSKARFTENGDWVVTEDRGGAYRAWSAATGSAIDLAVGGAESGESVILGLQGALARERGGRWQLWDIAANAPAEASLSLPADLDTLTRAPNGRLLATASYGSDVFVRDLTSDREVQRLNPRSAAVQNLQEAESVQALAFSPDSARLLTATSYGTVRLWDVASGRLAREFVGLAGGIDEARFSPDGELVAGVNGSSVQVWDCTTGQMVQQIAVPGARTLAFSADGRDLLVASPSATYRVRVAHLPDEPERIRAWVDALSLASWSEQGSPTPIGLPGLVDAWRRLDRHGGRFSLVSDHSAAAPRSPLPPNTR